MITFNPLDPNNLLAGQNDKGTDAHPIWSDTRNVDPYAPANGVIHDEDIFTDNIGLPNGQARITTGTVGSR